jgi:hypothetical protein
VFDGFPMPICHFKRVGFSKSFKGEAGYGYCAAKDETYYDFKGHLVISLIGVATKFTIAPANIDERDILPELTGSIFGLLIADKGLIRPELKEELARQRIDLQIPLRKNMKDDRLNLVCKKNSFGT